jgi:hypothetical protein
MTRGSSFCSTIALPHGYITFVDHGDPQKPFDKLFIGRSDFRSEGVYENAV